ncbi:hypothetical protein N8J89_37080 [Crossiella sp. CA-258035]|nr:hypothetical protein [Crossiella sp. CA-258035]WHT18662.1 hypothetical protein N8J89_37080 [Crossiella sp. CA-258035]
MGKAPATAVVELLGGLALMLGLATLLACAGAGRASLDHLLSRT